MPKANMELMLFYIKKYLPNSNIIIFNKSKSEADIINQEMKNLKYTINKQIANLQNCIPSYGFFHSILLNSSIRVFRDTNIKDIIYKFDDKMKSYIYALDKCELR
jgi:hypothetical protein